MTECMRCGEKRECVEIQIQGPKKEAIFKLCNGCYVAFGGLVSEFMKILKESKPFDDDTIMYFGKHQGKKLIDVPGSYLLWIADQDWMPRTHPKLLQYINRNRQGLEDEVAEND